MEFPPPSLPPNSVRYVQNVKECAPEEAKTKTHKNESTDPGGAGRQEGQDAVFSRALLRACHLVETMK